MLEVRRITASDCHDLRRRVLRSGTPSADVRFGRDDEPTTAHFGAFADGALTGIASCSPSPTPLHPGEPAWQLRGMAVEPERQGTGAGRALVAAVIDHASGEGATVLWANARDSALGFYARMGFAVEGAGFVTADTGLPHHVVLLDLRS
ncbi:MAG TPA: GNAT family N-acetyltransferase [Acidimicrobiales bacterium]